MAEPVDPDEMTTRRGWLSALARTARSRAQEASEALGPDGLGGLGGLVNQLDPFSDTTRAGDAAHDDVWAERTSADAWADATRVPARAPDRAVSLDELIALAHEEGLTVRDDELRSLARSSLRMTAVVPRCAEAWIRTTDEWVDAPGSEVLLAQIKLSATGDHGSGLPSDGWLVLFARSDDGPSEDEPFALDGVHAHGVLLDSPADVSTGPEPVALGPELVLPPAWHQAIHAIDFDGAELAAYARLRTRVQELQGVEREDDGGADIAYHRLFGYPDETTGTMADECEPDGSTDSDWRLLAQVSVGEWRRAYVWIRESDLKLGNVSELRAFVR